MTSTRVVAFSVAIAALLTGSAFAAPNHADQVVSAVRAAQQSLRDCVTALHDDPQFALLSPHIPVSVKGVTAEQRANNDVASDQEVALLVEFRVRTKTCRDSYLRQMQMVLPTVAALMAGAYSQNETIIADLIQKKLSWGDYVKRVETTYNALRPQLMTELQRIGDMLDQENPAQ